MSAPPKHLQEIQRPPRLTCAEINAFINFYGFSDQEFADLLSVSLQAVRLWKSGQREFSSTNSRLIRLFCKRPELMREF